MVLAPTSPIAEIPFHIGEDAIIVAATVNGKSLKFMYDTGFGGAFVLGPHVNVGKPTGKIMIRDFVGQFEAETIDVSSLKLGSFEIEVGEMELVQLPTGNYTEAYGTHVDGIMGLEVLKNYVTEINFENEKFVIHPDSMDINTRKPDGEKTFLLKMLPKGMNSIELFAKVSNGKRMILALDTGNAFYAVTHREVLVRVGLWPEKKKPKFMSTAYVASGPVDTWSLMISDLEVYGVPVPRSVWSIIDLPSSSASHDGTIGFGFLKHFNIVIDMGRRRVWLENFTGKVTDDFPAHIGLVSIYSRNYKRMVIVNVTPDGPAFKAGIKRGDHLLAIDDENLVKSSYRHVNSVLTGTEGTEVRLAVSRKGQLKRYTLKRALLVNE